MRRAIRHALVVAAMLLGGLILSACSGVAASPVADIETPRSSAANGIGDLSPEDALAKVHEALESAGTFRVQGLMRSGSELDIGFLVGVGASGSVLDPKAESEVEILAVNGKIYVTGDDALLAERIGDNIDDTVAGKWLELGKDSLARYEVFADADRFADAVLPTGEPMKMTGVRELRGVQVIGLMFEDSDSIVWVAATGSPVPIQLEEKGASANSGVLRFAVPGGDISIIAPTAEEIVSLTPAEPDPEEGADEGSEDGLDG